MKSNLMEVEELLTYFGPSLDEIINNAKKCGDSYSISKYNDVTEVVVNSNIPYGHVATDIYYYNIEKQLIKQVVEVNGRQKTVFDKYEEALSIIKKLDETHSIAS